MLDLGTQTLQLDAPVVMGVLNVTPDSFSDGGRFVDADAALRQAEQMLSEGATFIDVGGESTRPGADDVGTEEELGRVIPIIEAIRSRFDVLVSVDTSKPSVMTAAAAAGAAMINDVFALQRDGALEAAAATSCAVCLMHMQGEPRTMQADPRYEDIAGEVTDFLAERIVACRQAGIDVGRIVVDPGFGFGKVDQHNLRLLGELSRLNSLGRPMLIGISRKRTLGNVTGRGVEDREAAGIAAAVMAAERGALIVRTHDVAGTVDALKMVAAVQESTSGISPGE